MLKVYPIKPDKRSVIPAVTHADGTGRLQTVSIHHLVGHRLIKTFEKQTGVLILLNTSLNENEPIVNTPDEALIVRGPRWTEWSCRTWWCAPSITDLPVKHHESNQPSCNRCHHDQEP